MGFQRLFVWDLHTEHLTSLAEVAISCDEDAQRWVQDIALGALHLYSIGDRGLIGVYVGPRVVYVEFIVGKKLVPMRHEIVRFLQDTYQKPLDLWVRDARLVRLYEKMGARHVSRHMRFDYGRL